MFYSFLGLIKLLWAPTYASQQKGTGVSIFPATFLLLCQLHLGWTFAESCWEPPRRGSPTPSPEGHKPSPPLPALTCQSLSPPWLVVPLESAPPQHGHTYAHNCHAQMARQPLAFHLDLQKDSHGVYTFLLVPWKPCVSLRSTCSQRFCLCLCLVQGQSCCLWGHGLMWWTWQTTLKWLWRFQPGKISQG